MKSMNDSGPRLVLALHGHQPTGNTHEVFCEANDRCYQPILELLEKHAAIRMSLHYSGSLLEWLESHRPRTLEMVRELVTRGQVEVLGGGWQEPILSAIPPRDAQGQLRTMRYECARLFGVMPRGMWLAERVWDPEIPALAHDAGYHFTFVDDTHILHAGHLQEPVTGLYITERHGKPLTLFPISRQLRYAIPFRPPEKAIGIVDGDTTWTYGDDTEKFGLWPKTHEWVWEKGWLESFLAEMTQAQEEGRLHTVLPSQLLSRERPRARVHPPTDSYREMGQWSLPVPASSRLRAVREKLGDMEEEADPFLRGGIWSGFLDRYPESNWMHKRMLRVSRKVARAEREHRRLGTLPPDILDARSDLYRSQTNCAYWHGLFGGLYLPHLRRGLYRHMLRAENVVDPIGDGLRVTREDLDCDGTQEVLVETGQLTCAVTPLGGCLAELVHRPTCMRVDDTLARHRELYHEVQTPSREEGKEADGIHSIHEMDRSMDDGLIQRIVHDEHLRRSFMDVLLHPGEDPAGLENGTGRCLADLRSVPWEVQGVHEEDRKARITLLGEQEISGATLRITRRYTVSAREPRVTCTWKLDWTSSEPLETILVTQLNLNLLAGHAHDRAYEVHDPSITLEDQERFLDSRGRWERVAAMSLVDGHEKLRIRLDMSPFCDVVRHPVQSVSQSESGFQLTYQGSCVMLCWPLRLESWSPWHGRASLTITGF